MARRQPEKAEIQNLCQQLIATDPSRQPQLQDTLDKVTVTWQDTEDQLADRTRQCHDTLQDWAELENQMMPVLQGLARAAGVTEIPIKCGSREEAQELLAQHKVC